MMLWLLPRARHDLNDVQLTARLTLDEIAGVAIPATTINILALMFFSARHADDEARSHYALIRIPMRKVLTRGNTKGR